MTRPNGVTTTYAFDAADQIKEILHASSSGIIDQATYTYDQAGLRTSMSDHFGLHTYTYDPAGQLTAADNPAGQPDEQYTYDLLGNRISGGYGGQVVDAANRLISDNKYLYSYDAEGNLTTKTDRTLGAATTYSWDAEHRPRSVTLPGGAAQSYGYDPLGRRIEVSSSASSGAGTRRFAYGADQNMQAEFSSANSQQASYVFGEGLDTPLKMNRADSPAYYQQDALGSVTSLSSSTGESSQRYSYGAFGQPLTQQDASGNPFTFTGRELDSATGDYFYRARSYDAGVGRFTGEDPVRLARTHLMQPLAASRSRDWRRRLRPLRLPRRGLRQRRCSAACRSRSGWAKRSNSSCPERAPARSPQR